jgi:hypothetical protein
VSICGGRDYAKAQVDLERTHNRQPRILQLRLETTAQELYLDWVKKRNHYGRIRAKK